MTFSSPRSDFIRGTESNLNWWSIFHVRIHDAHECWWFMHASILFLLRNILWAWLNWFFDFDVQDSSKILIGESLCTQASFIKDAAGVLCWGKEESCQCLTFVLEQLPVLLLNRQGQWPRKGRWSHFIGFNGVPGRREQPNQCPRAYYRIQHSNRPDL